MSQFNDPTFGNPPPKKSSAMKWVIIVLLLLGGLVVVCCGGCMAMGWWGIGMAGQQVATEIKDTPPVQEHLGDNLKLSMNFTETANEQQKSGNDKVIVFDATGSKGNGTVIVTSGPGGQGTQSAVLRLPDGRELPLK